MWYRLYRQDGEEVGEIIAHDDIKISQDHRVSLEKRVFQDLAIYKLQVTLIHIYIYTTDDDDNDNDDDDNDDDDDDRFTMFLCLTREDIPATPSGTKTIPIMSPSPSSRETLSQNTEETATSSVLKNCQVKSWKSWTSSFSPTAVLKLAELPTYFNTA